MSRRLKAAKQQAAAFDAEEAQQTQEDQERVQQERLLPVLTRFQAIARGWLVRDHASGRDPRPHQPGAGPPAGVYRCVEGERREGGGDVLRALFSDTPIVRVRDRLGDSAHDSQHAAASIGALVRASGSVSADGGEWHLALANGLGFPSCGLDAPAPTTLVPAHWSGAA